MVLFFLLLFNAFNLAKLDCSFSASHCDCNNIQLDDFLDEFYKKLPVDAGWFRDFSLTIRQSQAKSIEYLPDVPADVRKLRIEDSCVHNVEQNAFREYQYLNELSLSGNNLTNISFVINLPQDLSKLYLDKNNISHIEDVFQKFINLKYLDLSYNHIDVLDLTIFHRIVTVNFFANRISNIIPKDDQYSCSMTNINLGRNLIKSFNETFLQCSFNQLDLSYNNLTVIEIIDAKYICNLAGNNVKIIQRSSNRTALFYTLDLSNQTIEIGSNWNILVKETLKLDGNKIHRLSNDTFDVKALIDENSYNRGKLRIDLSFCSISDIPESYFSNLVSGLLKLCFNNILELRNHIFVGSRIETLNLSFSQIQSIKNMTFSSSTITVLDLSHNNINNTKDVFNNMYANEIDLSFNKIQFIFKNSFRNVKRLEKLKLSNCVIQIIEAGAFDGLDTLQDLDISYNRLFILESNNFSNMPIRSINLEGNFITAVMSKAFNNLTKLVEINLSERGIETIEENAFYNLPAVRTVDLRNNSINTMPRNLFFGTKNLEIVKLSGSNLTDIKLPSNEIKIKFVSLTFNGILEPKNLSNVNVKGLEIQDSQIQVLKANTFDGLYNLNELNFTRSNIYSIELDALKHLYRLKYLDTQNLFKFTKNVTTNSFQDLKSLQILNLSSLSLEHLESYCFSGLVSLKSLLVNNNSLVQLNNFTFVGLESLEFLDLSQNKISTISDQFFSGLNKLKELRLNENSLTNFEVYLPTLKILHLEYNRISQLSRKTFLSLGQLEELHLNHNDVLSEIPVGIFQNLTNLKLMNLSHVTRLTVNVGALTNLRKLEKLDLSHDNARILNNYDQFHSLDSLTHLYLDGDSLSSLNIKVIANKLRKLKYVGISQNNWQCLTLDSLIEDLDAFSISYQPIIPYYDGPNINGVRCN